MSIEWPDLKEFLAFGDETEIMVCEECWYCEHVGENLYTMPICFHADGKIFAMVRCKDELVKAIYLFGGSDAVREYKASEKDE